MHLVFTILDAYIHDPYERTCLAMTCKDLKQLYYSANYVFKTCRKTIQILCFLRPQQLVEICYYAYLRNDDHVFLVRMMKLCPTFIGECICNDLSRSGRLLLLQKVLEEAVYQEAWCEKLCVSAACTGQIRIMEWLLDSGHSKLPTEALTEAARCGQLRVIAFCLNRQPELWCDEVAMCASRAGHVRVLMWCLKNGFAFDVRKAASTAAERGDRFTVMSIAKLAF